MDTIKYYSTRESTSTNTDTIQDFTKGMDVFDLSQLSGQGIDEFSDLTITDNGTTTTISEANSGFEISLIGSIALDSGDFIF